MTSDNSADVRDAHPPRPYLMIGLALFGVIVLAVGAALLLDRHLRPRLGIKPATETIPRATPPANTSSQEAGQPSAVMAPKAISGPADIQSLGSPLEREVATAYLHYWTVYAEAMETLDPSRLAEVAAGDILRLTTEDVEQSRRDGEAARIQIKHSFSVISIAPNQATVRDEYTNSSYAIDPQTKQPIGAPGQSERLTDTYTLRRIDGVWKVVAGVRA